MLKDGRLVFEELWSVNWSMLKFWWGLLRGKKSRDAQFIVSGALLPLFLISIAIYGTLLR